MPRTLPEVTRDTAHFWGGGRDGELRLLHCRVCGYWLHPPGPICPRCWSDTVVPAAVSGRATVATFSVNHQRWYAGLEVPYVVAIVELPEQPALRLTTEIVGCEPDDVSIGMPVVVRFEQLADDVWLPLFTPAEVGA